MDANGARLPHPGAHARGMKATCLAAEFAILRVLASSGSLTLAQLATQAQLTTGAARGAVARLESRGLIVAPGRGCRWEITSRGKGEWITKGRRFTL